MNPLKFRLALNSALLMLSVYLLSQNSSNWAAGLGVMYTAVVITYCVKKMIDSKNVSEE